MMQKGVVNWIGGVWAEIVSEPGTPFNHPCVLFPDLKEGDPITIQVGNGRAGEKATMERIVQLRVGLNKTPL
jgi:hypothetical protein